MFGRTSGLLFVSVLLIAVRAGSCFISHDGMSERNFRFNNFFALPAASGHSPFYSDSDLSDLLIRWASRVSSPTENSERSESLKPGAKRQDSCAYPPENRNFLGGKMPLPPLGLLRPANFGKPLMK
mmetsp:Transcript_5085/g.18270  ORF Transcript_5085/g.18270 Transcript_5085/m.18270 type:complete len:126 (-) Transcript_5085:231-608(-)